MKKNNLWRIIWIIGIYAVLVFILYLVVVYKVKWEGKDLNTYLYFYECSNQLCTSVEQPLNYFSSIQCKDNICPFITEKNDNIVVLSNNNKQYLYDYINGKIVDDNYDYYSISNGNSFIVKDEVENMGVINNKGELLVELSNEKITNYKDGYIVYEVNNKYGIKNIAKNINIDANYEDIVLINDKLFAYRTDNKYLIASYDKNIPIIDTEYDYLYSVDNTIIVFRDNKLDILNENLKSKLIMPIETYYKYSTEKERGTLNFTKHDRLLYFNINKDEEKLVKYIYDLNNKKLV